MSFPRNRILGGWLYILHDSIRLFLTVDSSLGGLIVFALYPGRFRPVWWFCRFCSVFVKKPCELAL